MFPLRIPSVGFQPFLTGDDLKQTTALIPAFSILLTLLVFMMGGFVHASVDSSFRSKPPSSVLFTVSEGGTHSRRNGDWRLSSSQTVAYDFDLDIRDEVVDLKSLVKLHNRNVVVGLLSESFLDRQQVDFPAIPWG
jgi:hypothetical protein